MAESCGCIKQMNKALEPQNAQIIVNLFDPTYTAVALWKIDEKKRTKLPILCASFCPFCGKKTPGHSKARNRGKRKAVA